MKRPATKGNLEEVLREQARTERLLRFGRDVEPPNGAPIPTREQLTEPFRHVLQYEYRNVRRLCDLTAEQRRNVARAGEAALEVAALQYHETRIKRRGPRALGQYPFPDCGRIIQAAFVEALRGFVSPEAAERYRVETEQRVLFRKQAVVRNLVAQFDTELFLSGEQTNRLYESLLSGWTDAWAERIPASSVVGMPGISTNLVLPHLNDNQRALWEQASQGDRGYSAIVEKLPVEDAEDEDLAEARRAANGDTSERPRKPERG